MKVLKSIFFVVAISLLPCHEIFGQILFLEECFEGGVTGAGFSATPGSGAGQAEIRLEEGSTIRRALAITHRYGRPSEWSYSVNNTDVPWNSSNQVGPEMIDGTVSFAYFAVNVSDITDLVTIDNNFIEFELLNWPNEGGNNEGWWSIYVLILYENDLVTDMTCVRMYTANQRQDAIQDYSITQIDNMAGTDVGFAIYTDRISSFFSDRSRVKINNSTLGAIYGPDASNPLFISGTRGHFYYENETLYGLDDDTANTTIDRTDAIAVINEYLNPGVEQEIEIRRVESLPNMSSNAHPAFFITYTPECDVLEGEMPGNFAICEGDTAFLQATVGFDNYQWEPSIGLNDASIANPICVTDSSRWYMVRMWNNDGGTCAQTIPVFVQINPLPAPENLAVSPTSCPGNSGRINLINSAGTPPFTHSINGEEQASPVFLNLAEGLYQVSTVDNLGCVWEADVELGLDPFQNSAFTTNPETGESPLTVYLSNQSTGADGYIWLIDGEPFSTSFNTSYTFSDSGFFEIGLVAWRSDLSCADTSTFSIRVDAGIKIIMPNIISPNGDGRNDQVRAQIFGVKELNWTIFNRWGTALFTGSDASGNSDIVLWDGQHEGNEVPEGVYFISCTALGNSGRIEIVQFQITVVR